jgi:hypothetical protein
MLTSLQKEIIEYLVENVGYSYTACEIALFLDRPTKSIKWNIVDLLRLNRDREWLDSNISRRSIISHRVMPTYEVHRPVGELLR